MCVRESALLVLHEELAHHPIIGPSRASPSISVWVLISVYGDVCVWMSVNVVYPWIWSDSKFAVETLSLDSHRSQQHTRIRNARITNMRTPKAYNRRNLTHRFVAQWLHPQTIGPSSGKRVFWTCVYECVRFKRMCWTRRAPAEEITCFAAGATDVWRTR